MPVSYYLDEDENDGFLSYKRFDTTDTGDETETRRGSFVATAIMGYILNGQYGRWTGQTHLDLSTDFTAPENATLLTNTPERADPTQMGAFALSTPTVADLDADGSPEVLMGTSMGLLYAFDARNMFQRENWPVQVKRPIEQPILVEDVLGNTNLEVFAADIGGNVYCLNHEAQVQWHRGWMASLNLGGDVELTASSPMSLGDINLDGKLDLVQVIRTNNQRSFIFAVTAADGTDLSNFSLEIDGKPKFPEELTELHQKLAQPLLVDLHADQSYVPDYLRRNGTTWQQSKPSSRSVNPPPGQGPACTLSSHTAKISLSSKDTRAVPKRFPLASKSRPWSKSTTCMERTNWIWSSPRNPAAS